jgi:hypothetical protein
MCLFSEYKVCVWMSRSHISWVEGYVDSLLLTPWNRTCLCHNTLEPNTIAQIEALRRPSKIECACHWSRRAELQQDCYFTSR